MNTVQVGVIGLGFIGKLHIDSLRRLPYVRVVAVSSAVQEEMELIGNAFGIEKRYKNWEDLVQDPDVQVVHDCAPVQLHGLINSRCIMEGKSIYSEKPLAMDSADAERQIAALDEQPVANAVGHQYRSNAAVHAIKEKLQSGNCGKLLFIRGRYFQESLCREQDYSLRLVPENSPARALSDLGSHLADLIIYLTDSSFASVCANMITHYPERIDVSTGRKIAIHSDDTTIAQFVLNSGVPGIFEVSKAAHGHQNDLEIAIECSECELVWKQQVPDRYEINSRGTGNCTVIVDSKYASDSIRPLISLPAGHVMGWTEALKNNMQMFYQSIREGSWKNSVPYTTFRDELAVQQFIDACINSSCSRGWTDIGGVK